MNRTSRACTPGGDRGERATPGLHDLSKSLSFSEDVLIRFFEISKSVENMSFASDTDVPYLLEWVEHFISPQYQLF
jgi:hypothetical protein